MPRPTTLKGAPSSRWGLRLRFWLFVVDALFWLGLYGTRAYLYAVERAGALTDWGEGGDCRLLGARRQG